jgi:hypothetical protein
VGVTACAHVGATQPSESSADRFDQFPYTTSIDEST